MSLGVYRSLISKSRVLKHGLASLQSRSMSGHNKPNLPINEPPNDHLTFRPAILDDLPEPKGDWLEDYKQRQKKYWMHFFMGLISLSATIYYMYAYEPIFFNFYAVELPPKEERIKSFWVEPEDDDEED